MNCVGGDDIDESRPNTGRGFHQFVRETCGGENVKNSMDYLKYCNSLGISPLHKAVIKYGETSLTTLNKTTQRSSNAEQQTLSSIILTKKQTFLPCWTQHCIQS